MTEPVASARRPNPSVELDEAAIRSVVEAFYERARVDPLLGPVFDAAVADWPHHFALLTDFWSSVALGTGRYHGRPLPAHVKLPLTPEMFGRWLTLWGETVDARCTPQAAALLKDRAERIARSFSLAMFFRPDEPGFAAWAPRP